MPKKSRASSSKPKRNTVLLGLALRQRAPSGKWRIRFLWGRIFGLFAALIVLGYLLGITALYIYFKERRNYSDLSFKQAFTIPFDYDSFKVKRGDYEVEQAIKFMEEGDFRQAYLFLIAGVAHSPGNLKGRMLLAEFNLMANKSPESAIEALRGGIPYAQNNVEYLKRYIQLLLKYQLDFEVMEVTEKLLANNPDEDTQTFLALAAATAHFYRGNFDEAEDYIRTYNLDDQLEGTLLSARVSWERGQRQAAISKLEFSIGKFISDEPIYAQLSTFYRSLEDYEKARQYAVLRGVNAPLSVAPRIDYLHSLDKTEKREEADREAEAILKQFNNDEKSLLSLANYGTESGRVDLARRIYEQALENDFNVAPFALLLIEAHITSGDYQGAINFTEQLSNESPEWLEREKPVFNSLRAVAYYGVGNEDLSDIYLNQFLKDSKVRVETLMAVSRRYIKLGGKEQARKILVKAVKDNESNQVALSKLIELEIDMGNSAQLGDYLKSLLQMRRPSVELLEKAYRSLGSDRFIFTKNREALLIELDTILNPDKQPS